MKLDIISRDGEKKGNVDLPVKLNDREAGIAGDGPNPGASAQSRYPAKSHA